MTTTAVVICFQSRTFGIGYTTSFSVYDLLPTINTANQDKKITLSFYKKTTFAVVFLFLKW